MAIDIEEEEDDAFDFPTSVSDDMRKLVVWMMQPKRKARPQAVDEILERLEEAPQPNVEQKVVEVETEDKSEETIILPQTKIDNNIEREQAPEKAQNYIEQTSDEDGQTILVVSHKDEVKKSTSNSLLPSRSICVGDFVFDDGTYSDSMENKPVIGVLFSKYGGAHGQLVSSVVPDEHLSINGKELKWHKASIGEWVEIINNLGKCKVNFVSWEYKYFSDSVRSYLITHLITEPRYATRKSVSGVAYIVNLESTTMIPLDNNKTDLPYIYITEF